ncbi:nitroreductase family protein [Streptomyces sp. MUM 203J]|uniref:Acg family FMN-binding oxidoreductase n=1 Tax=Streptomyces sp. MUM 203J TaxID=2791990 RepID=UPI001F04E665|nr:nitroreductase [Streptomyces sp. MUM 203J]MCH0540777.1 nitroreductase family protein [Streptomyces sp. MUM 203J]
MSESRREAPATRVRALDTATVTSLVEDATTAPSMHNAQPWLFRWSPAAGGLGVLRMRLDPARALPHADPDRRALHVGCGAALFNLRVAAAHAGREAEVTLLPDPGDPELLAEVTFERPVPPGDVLATLYPELRRRRTNRFPFSEEPVPEALRETLCGAAVAEGTRMVFLDDWQADEALELVRDAEAEEAADPEVRAEIARWTWRAESAEAPGGRAEGIPSYAFGPHRHEGRAPVRDFARGARGREEAVFERRPCLAVLGTREDRPVDWLRAGQAMERVLLEATQDGLATSLNSHALEWPGLRWAVRDPRSSMGYAQMTIRFGYGPEVPATPRRPVEEVLTVDAAED